MFYNMCTLTQICSTLNTRYNQNTVRLTNSLRGALPSSIKTLCPPIKPIKLHFTRTQSKEKNKRATPKAHYLRLLEIWACVLELSARFIKRLLQVPFKPKIRTNVVSVLYTPCNSSKAQPFANIKSSSILFLQYCVVYIHSHGLLGRQL